MYKRQFFDQFRLEAEEVIRGNDIFSKRWFLTGRFQFFDQFVQQVVSRALIIYMKKFFQNTAFVRDHAEHVFVIVGNVKFFGQKLCNVEMCIRDRNRTGSAMPLWSGGSIKEGNRGSWV